MDWLYLIDEYMEGYRCSRCPKGSPRYVKETKDTAYIISYNLLHNEYPKWEMNRTGTKKPLFMGRVFSLEVAASIIDQFAD